MGNSDILFPSRKKIKWLGRIRQWQYSTCLSSSLLQSVQLTTVQAQFSLGIFTHLPWDSSSFLTRSPNSCVPRLSWFVSSFQVENILLEMSFWRKVAWDIKVLRLYVPENAAFQLSNLNDDLSVDFYNENDFPLEFGRHCSIIVLLFMLLLKNPKPFLSPILLTCILLMFFSFFLEACGNFYLLPMFWNFTVYVLL